MILICVGKEEMPRMCRPGTTMAEMVKRTWVFVNFIITLLTRMDVLAMMRQLSQQGVV